MCYMVYISTESPNDLTAYNSRLVNLSSPVDTTKEERAISVLSFPYLWHVGSRSGCSCGFRHVHPDLGFSEPEDWLPEEDEDVEATKQVYKIFSDILETGSRLDCLSVWSGAESNDIETITISFNDINKNQFRFFTNHLFIIQK